MLSVEEKIHALLLRQKLTLGTAESCTGGLVSHRITNMAGSSVYFMGGIVSYSNEIKAALLGVSHETLTVYGAVSKETVLEMARGARKALGVDIAVSVSGIAGPGGGTDEKPVGTTWVGLSAANVDLARHFLWHGGRQQNKQQSAEAALQIVLDHLEGNLQ